MTEILDHAGVSVAPSVAVATPMDPARLPTYADRTFALRWERLRLSQAAFAEKYCLTLAAVKDLEQGRWRPARAMCMLIAAIEADPERMARIAARERSALEDR